MVASNIVEENMKGTSHLGEVPTLKKKEIWFF